MSRFQDVEERPPIQVFHLNKQFIDDTYKTTVNLTLGAYRDEEGKPWVLPVVRKVEKQISADSTLLHEYLPVLGMEQFCNASVSLLLGPDSPAIASGRTLCVQTLSGTGALKLGAEILNKYLKYTTFYCANPTWENQPFVFINSGFTIQRQYRYWHPESQRLDLDGFLEDLKNAPENSVIILQPCAHNPTGVDPTHEQWEKIADVMEECKLFPFFDTEFLGFASGNPDRDAWSVRYFVNRGFEIMCGQSYAKTFGLYNERIGSLSIVVSDASSVAPLRSQVTWIVQGMYSNPPAHGARIIATILNSDHLFDEWRDDMKTMTSRIYTIREGLRAEILALGTPGNWDHIMKQIGIFGYTGLSPRQCKYLIQEYHIYLLMSGRISVCGLNPSNVMYVARAIHDAVHKFPVEQEP